MKDMNIKDYTEMPDSGMFDKIQHRLSVRRAWRIGGAAAAGVAIVAAALLLLPQNRHVAVSTNVEVAEVQIDKATVSHSVEATESTQSLIPATSQTSSPSVAANSHTDGTAAVIAQAEVVTPEDDHSYLAALLPQGTPAVQPLDEPEEQWQNYAVAELLNDNAAESTRPTSASATPEKAGQPQPHYDNVIWAPNVIVPGGEVDENRTFSIKTTSEFTDFKMHIYNRAGRRIFLSTDPAFVWDGTIEGTNVPQGAYVWVATFRDSDGVPRIEKGTVTVIR